MSSTIRSLVDTIRSIATSSRDQGNRFEQLMRLYFLNDPLYKGQFSDVWFWTDWPDRGKEPDTGIDLVAKIRDEDGFVAIQCKCYSEDATINRSDIDSFLVRSTKKPFTRRIIVSTTAKWSPHAEDAIHEQTPHVQRLDFHELENSAIDWSQFDFGTLDGKPGKVHLKRKKELREHQTQALKAVSEGFKTNDRGQLIMACGTGKTFTSLKIAEKLAGKGGTVLFLVPSLSLLSQTLREWTAESTTPLHPYAVCSDTMIGRHDDTEPTTPDDLAIPPTTDGKELSKSFAASKWDDKMTVVFSTYQSIDAINDAQKRGVPEFDLVICDEAHRTTGAVLESKEESQFVRVHDAKFIKAKKRLYMTATPRLYSSESKTKAKDGEVKVWSMDDEAVYGPELYRLGFSKAVSQDLLCDYKVIVLAVSEKHVSRAVQKLLNGSGGKDETEDAVKIIGCWNGLSRQFLDDQDDAVTGGKRKRPVPMKRAVAFTTKIVESTLFAERFTQIVDEYCTRFPNKNALKCEVRHVDGKLNALKRTERLEWLKDDRIEKNHCRILSNARCLSEGIDVPALDAVMFLKPRKSKVDIVQSVGRVMRKAEGKEYGYIILPISISPGEEPDKALDNDDKYRVVWDVLQALRAHDDRFNITINQMELDKIPSEKIQVIGIGDSGDDTDEIAAKTQQVTQQRFDFGDIEEWKNAIYGKIVAKCGTKPYWEHWAKEVADIATRQIETIERLLADEEHHLQFTSFLEGLRSELNPELPENEAIEMLSQHLITKPVFDAIFGNSQFTKNNPVSVEMDKIASLLEDVSLENSLSSLAGFYKSVQEKASGLQTAEGKQRIIIKLYDQFFKTAFPRMAERLGIVYTPVEVVDFIIHSVDVALKQEFKSSIGAKDVHVLDPFTGTGTFIVRLLQSGLIAPKDLLRKYQGELHANEIVLLAYYIAAINIEEAFHELDKTQRNVITDFHLPFEGIVLTDTFLMTEEDGTFEQTKDLNNSNRAKRQRKTPIRVIIGNPPYSAGQRSQNDNNQNQAYPQIDEKIRNSYGVASSAALQRNLFDSYIRAFRWASDRIGNKGIICFVSNGSYIDGNAMDGVRKCFEEEFTDIYCFNCRGNQRTSGELSKKEGGKIFGSGSRAQVAITLFIKNPVKKNGCTIHYHDIGDYLSQKAKLDIIKEFSDLKNVPWETIVPNDKYDWINQRDDTFDGFLGLGDKSTNATLTIFDTYSLGVATNRDAWCYNFSKKQLSHNLCSMIAFYNEQLELFAAKSRIYHNEGIEVESVIDTNPSKISWSRGLKGQLARGVEHRFHLSSVVPSIYRPFCRQYLYFNRSFNESPGQNPLIFPRPDIQNYSICITGRGATRDFSALITNTLPDLEMISKAQCFPFYTYEPDVKRGGGGRMRGLLDEDSDGEIVGDYIRRENITDAALQKFREHYGEKKITKEDIFYYIYGILNCRTYQERFAAELKKQLPRVPFAKDFWGFSKGGRRLAELHLNYEAGKMFPLKEIWASDKRDYAVTETGMKFPSKTDMGRIIYNASLTLDGIPEAAYRYIVNGKSALEWIMERYRITTHKDSGIVNDPNDWCKEHDDPQYIVNLVKRIVQLSVESVKIIDELPELVY